MPVRRDLKIILSVDDVIRGQVVGGFSAEDAAEGEVGGGFNDAPSKARDRGIV